MTTISFLSAAQKTLLSFVLFLSISEHVISFHQEILLSKKTWKTRYSRENIMKHIHLLLVCTWRHYGNNVGGQEQKYFYPLGTKHYSNTNSLKYFYCIHHFYRDHDAPCSPPNFCTTIVFNFSLACSRLLDSSLLAEAGTKIKREENWREKRLFPATTFPTSRDYIFTCLTVTRHPHYLRAWGKQGASRSRWKWSPCHVVCKPRIGYFVIVLETGSVLSWIVLWDCMFPAQPRGNQ